MTEQFPPHLAYTPEHQWVDDAEPATVGITWTAQDALGDIVFLELPGPGTAVTAGAVVGEVESTKSVSEIFSPVTGTVVETNAAAVEDPARVNTDPYGEGWLFRVADAQRGTVLTAQEYQERFGS